MKNALLILIMFLLPLQSLIAAERNVAHIMEGGNTFGMGFVAKHMADHAAVVPHHHEDENVMTATYISMVLRNHSSTFPTSNMVTA